MASKSTTPATDSALPVRARAKQVSSRRSQQAELLENGKGDGGNSAKVPGIRELAAALGLGISTVSRAMNNRDRVDEKTRKRVLAMARKIGYVPDATARRLKSHPRLRIEMLFSPYPDRHHMINPAAVATVEALRRRAAERGILLTLREISEPGSLAGVAVATDVMAQMEKQAAEVIVTYGYFHKDTLDVLRHGNVPVVCLQSMPQAQRHISVVVNTRGAAYEAVKYLAALGHLRFALISGELVSLHHRGYIEGFAEAVDEFRLAAPEAWQIRLPVAQINEEGGMEAVAPLLALPAQERPTALVFGSDWLALGGLKAAQQAGLRVPADVSLIGFDNVALTAQVSPPLTTFDVHHDAMADAVLDAATELMENRNAPESAQQAIRMVNADLVKRASCGSWGR